MTYLYVLAVWIHILTVCFWIGAMFFGDPESTRFFSKLFERKLGGVGWYAQTVLWVTGLFMLHDKGILGQLFTADFIASAYGRVLWIKILLVLTLLTFQITIGNKPSKMVYGYILVAFATVGMAVLLVRPIIF
ncbi:hypothetical protein [Candidatus Entotheonella palauensis]|uniref:Copper resistance protein D domain-containing protein n=1 Tax=Candidatus Entotheonella gemina TaxID=1429439 RepID=W4ME21_9BACT|nr:hypothetical protein [Candidatus Entotheonella palauensis]ETX08589.1 MAG: hypothetical protein ETSY2_04480 [Candidatus Entotheonella gemina]